MIGLEASRSQNEYCLEKRFCIVEGGCNYSATYPIRRFKDRNLVIFFFFLFIDVKKYNKRGREKRRVQKSKCRLEYLVLVLWAILGDVTGLVTVVT